MSPLSWKLSELWYFSCCNLRRKSLSNKIFKSQNIGRILRFGSNFLQLTSILSVKFQDPFKNPKKRSSGYKVRGAQNDRLEPTVSTRKSVFKNMAKMYPNFSFQAKCQKFIPFRQYLWTPMNIFQNQFALKPWVQAGRFEYHKPHNRKNFFPDLFRGFWNLKT